MGSRSRWLVVTQVLTETETRRRRSTNTDLYKYSPDAVPPIHAVSYHVATDKPPAQDGDKFRYDNLQPVATRGKKARSTLLVDPHCGNGCSIKRAPLSVSYYNEISGGHIGRGVVRRRCSAGPIVPLWVQHPSIWRHPGKILRRSSQGNLSVGG